MSWFKKLLGGHKAATAPVVAPASVPVVEVPVIQAVAEAPAVTIPPAGQVIAVPADAPAAKPSASPTAGVVPKKKSAGKPAATKVNMKWLKSANSGIAQVYSSGLQYALVNDDYQQCHDFVFCKDFIQDAYHGFLHNQPASIYGFTYNPTTQPPLSLNKLRIVLVNSKDAKMGEKIPGVMDFINQFCKKMKLKPSRAIEVENPPKAYTKCGAWIIEGSGMWINAPVLISMYSLLLRVGFTHTVGADAAKTVKNLVDGKTTPYQNNDRYQLQSAQKGIEQILKYGYRKHFFIDTVKNYPAGTQIGTMHNSTGIVAFSTGGSRSVCKYWTRKSITNPKPKDEAPAEGGEAPAAAEGTGEVKKAPKTGD
jgi:hypothetical protein